MYDWCLAMMEPRKKIDNIKALNSRYRTQIIILVYMALAVLWTTPEISKGLGSHKFRRLILAMNSGY